MKALKKVLALMLVAVMAVGLVGCGEISYDDITGDWTTKTVNDMSIDDYAASLGVSPAQVTTNMTITDDDKIVATSATASQNYVYERKADGIEVKEEGKDDILFSMAYDTNAKTFSYKLDIGNGQTMTIVLEKGKADLTVTGATDAAQ
ncbi:MAG: hypothetical protein SOZ48_09935 [Eubacterium sp.]|nr:hypothetical protein [Eubacterium sp.]